MCHCTCIRELSISSLDSRLCIWHCTCRKEGRYTSVSMPISLSMLDSNKLKVPSKMNMSQSKYKEERMGEKKENAQNPKHTSKHAKAGLYQRGMFINYTELISLLCCNFMPPSSNSLGSASSSCKITYVLRIMCTYVLHTYRLLNILPEQPRSIRWSKSGWIIVIIIIDWSGESGDQLNLIIIVSCHTKSTRVHNQNTRPRTAALCVCQRMVGWLVQCI